jgi:hypothetical protein
MMIPRPTLSFKNLLIFILLGVIVILYFKQCGKKAPSQSLAIETAKKQVIDSSQKVLVNYRDSVTKVIAQRDDRIDSIQGEAEVYRYERNVGWATIKDKDNMINSLSTKILDENGKDTSDCIEIAKQSQIQSKRLQEQEGITVKLLDDLHLLSKVKDSTISDERRIKNAALKQGQETALAYSGLFAEYKKLQPHNQVFLGADGDINPMQAQVGGAIGFLNKRGTFYIAKTGITTNAQYYVGGTVLFRISFRKK